MVVLTTILIVAAVAVLYAFVWRDGSVWTPIPASMWAWLVSIVRGSWGLTLYRLFVLAVLLAIGAAVVSIDPMFGSFLISLVFVSLAGERVRSWVFDLWNANFAVLEVT